MLMSSVATPKSFAICGRAVTIITPSRICMNIEAATTRDTLRECAEKLWDIGLTEIASSLSIHPAASLWANIVVLQSS